MLKIIVLNAIRIRHGLSRRLYKLFYSFMLESIGRNCQIDSTVHMAGIDRISLGDNCFLNREVLLQSCDGATIKLGDDVVLSYGVKILTGGLDYENDPEATKKHIVNSVFIDENTWVGANSLILQGVRIGKNVVVAAGSVVTKDVDDNCLVGGVPAKIIKHIAKC